MSTKEYETTPAGTPGDEMAYQDTGAKIRQKNPVGGERELMEMDKR